MRLEMMRGLEGHVKDVGKSLQAGGGCEHNCASKRSRSLLRGEKVTGLSLSQEAIVRVHAGGDFAWTRVVAAELNRTGQILEVLRR